MELWKGDFLGSFRKNCGSREDVSLNLSVNSYYKITQYMLAQNKNGCIRQPEVLI